jgi:hypothetical protein
MLWIRSEIAVLRDGAMSPESSDENTIKQWEAYTGASVRGLLLVRSVTGQVALLE